MRDLMKKTVFLLMAVCILTVCTAGAADSMHREIRSEAFDMEMTIGYDGLMTYGKVMPVRVRIRNFGGDFEGVLGINAYISRKEYDRYETGIALPAGSEREFELAVTVYSRQDIFTAEIVKDGEVLCALSQRPDGLVNPGAMLIGVLSNRPRNLNSLNIDRQNDILARYELWQTIPLTADTFPENTGTLRSFGMLVLDDIDPSTLNEKQKEALDGWLRSGRILLCGGGATAGRNTAFLNSYTGLKLEEITASSSVPEGLETLIGRSKSGKKVTAAIAQYSGAEPMAYDAEGNGLIWRTEVGAGRIYTAAFETGDPRLNSENLMHYFWQQLLLDHDQNLYGTLFYSDSDSYSSAAIHGGYAMPVRAKSYLVPGLIIVAGALVLSCVLWWVLKKRDKRQGMWIVLPAIAVLCVACIAFLSRPAETNRSLAVITENIIQDSSGTLRNYIGISAAAPEFGRHRYSTAGENLRVVTYDYVDYDEEEDNKNKQEPDVLRTCYTAGGENAVSVESITPWEQVNLNSDSAVQFHGEIDGEVWMEEDGLHGEIVNRTEISFAAGHLITSYGWQNVPALAPGERAEVYLTRRTFADPKNPKYEEGGLYMENPGMYSVINTALGYDDSTAGVTRNQFMEREIASSMINGATDMMRRGRGNWSYGAYESALFIYSAAPEDAEPSKLYVDGRTVEQESHKMILTAELPFVPVGRTGVLFRSAGMDVPERVETDENLLPTDKAAQNGKQIYYHALNEVPTFLYRVEGIGGVKISTLQVLMDSYYNNQVRVYALNAETRVWEEIGLNMDVKDPGKYLDKEGKLYLQFRSDTQDMYADIPTPLINLEGRTDHAEN